MSNINSVNIVIPQVVIDQAKADIKKALDALKPYTIALTPDERRTVPKMGDKTLAFVMKVQEYAANAPEFAPKFMNVPDFDTDVTAASQLTQILQFLTPFALEIDDTIMLSGSEAYISALMYYNSVREAAERNIPGAKGIYDDLKARFERPGRRPIPPVA